MKLEKRLQQFGSVPFSRSALLSLLHDYRRPNDKIARLSEEGVLIPLKKGFYVLGPDWRAEPVCLPLIANNLYGPSCVSLEWALAWRGLIPEGVFSVTSVTSRRAKSYQTPAGYFTYQHVPESVLLTGAELTAFGERAHYLIAGPTKALCDKVLLTRNLRLNSVFAMREFLEEDLRLDRDAFGACDRAVIHAYRQAGKKVGLFELLEQALEQWP